MGIPATRRENKSRVLLWVKLMRLHYYPATFLILFTGISVAVSAGASFRGETVGLMVLGNFLLHAACSFINEYTDSITGADLAAYPELGWNATGGTKVLVRHLVEPSHVLYGSFLFFISSCSIWFLLSFRVGVPVTIGLMFALLVSFLYSSSFSGGGFLYVREILLSFGSTPLIIMAVVKLLSLAYTRSGVVAGVVVGMQMFNYLLYHGLIDLEADYQSGKRRLTRFTGLKTLKICAVLMVGTFVILGSALYVHLLPFECVITFVLTPLAAKVVYDEMRAKNILETYTRVVLSFVLTTTLLSSGFWLSVI